MNAKEKFIFWSGFGGGTLSVGASSLILFESIQLFPSLFPILSIILGSIIMIGSFFYWRNKK